MKAAMEARNYVHPSGEIVKLTQYVAWKGHLFSLERELKCEPNIKYVLYPDDSNAGWRIHCVSAANDSFESRAPLPAGTEEAARQTKLCFLFFIYM